MEQKKQDTKKPVRKFAPMKQITMTKTYFDKVTIREFKGIFFLILPKRL